MAENSKIEWTHHTCNLWHGCTKVHAGCDHCYAETMSHRWGRDIWGNDKPRMIIKSAFKDLEKFQRLANDAGEIHRVFVGSMMDIGEKSMPAIDSKGNDCGVTGQYRDELFRKIDMTYFPNLLFLFLSKRPSNYNKQIPDSWKENQPDNVMFGTSVSDQETADTLIPQLLQVNGYKFLSIEPQLGPVSLARYATSELRDNHLFTTFPIHWIIVGGESGPGKRPFDCDWARQLRNECKIFGPAFFMKQIDKVQSIPEDLLIREFPKLPIYEHLH